MQIQDVMQKDVIAVHCDTSMLQLPKIFSQNRLGGLPVVSADQKLVGIVSVTDVLRKLAGLMLVAKSSKAVKDNLASAKVDEIMTPKVLAVSPDEDVQAVADRMITNRVHRVVVVNEDQEILGIVSSFDLLLAISQRGAV